MSLTKTSLFPKTINACNGSIKNYLTRYTLFTLFGNQVEKRDLFLKDQRIHDQNSPREIRAVCKEYFHLNFFQKYISLPLCMSVLSKIIPLFARQIFTVISDDLNTLLKEKNEIKEPFYKNLHHAMKVLSGPDQDTNEAIQSLKPMLQNLIKHYLNKTGLIFALKQHLKKLSANEKRLVIKMFIDFLTLLIILPYLIEKKVKNGMIPWIEDSIRQNILDIPNKFKEFHERNPQFFATFIDECINEYFLDVMIKQYEETPTLPLSVLKTMEVGLGFFFPALYPIYQVTKIAASQGNNFEFDMVNLLATLILPFGPRILVSAGTTIGPIVKDALTAEYPKDLLEFRNLFMKEFSKFTPEISEEEDDDEYFDCDNIADDEFDDEGRLDTDEYFDPIETEQDKALPLHKIEPFQNGLIRFIKSASEKVCSLTKKAGFTLATKIKEFAETQIFPRYESSKKVGFEWTKKATEATIALVAPAVLSSYLPDVVELTYEKGVDSETFMKIDEKIEEFFNEDTLLSNSEREKLEKNKCRPIEQLALEKEENDLKAFYAVRTKRNVKIKELIRKIYSYNMGTDLGSETIANTLESLVVDSLNQFIDQTISMSWNENLIRGVTLAFLNTYDEHRTQKMAQPGARTR